jgi:hypothetical protein
MRPLFVPALAAALAAAPEASGETIVRRMTAECEYAVRNRIEDRDGFWFATFALRGHAFPNERADRSFALACIGAAWGNGGALGGEEAVCRLADDQGVLFGRVRGTDGTATAATLALDIYGGRGSFAGYAGSASAERAMDLTGERPSGRGLMTLRLALAPSANGGE